MGKFYGAVGFAKTVEVRKGVWKEELSERNYYGDVIRKTRRLENSQSANDNVNVNNSISIVADEHAYMNIFAIRYVKWMGASWKVTDVEVERPRLILSIGGLYNGNETRPSRDS